MLTEHTHIPVSAGMVARDGGPLAEHYRRTHDPFVALAFAAAATEKLVLGTSVCLVTEHDPIVLAKVITLAAEPVRRAVRVRRSARAGTSPSCSTTAPTRPRGTG